MGVKRLEGISTYVDDFLDQNFNPSRQHIKGISRALERLSTCCVGLNCKLIIS